jgi:class 3 adenylate cyclase
VSDGPVRSGPVRRLASIGFRPGDDADERVRKATLTLSTSLITVLSTGWTTYYFTLGLPRAAAIPLAYQLVSLVSLAVFARTKRYGGFRTAQLAIMLVFPFLLQWTPGGFVPSGAVALWALSSPLGALMFAGTRQAWPWFAGFVALVVASGPLDRVLEPVSIPASTRAAFFVADVIGVSLTAYLLLQYFVRERERERERSERLLLNVLPAPVAERLKEHQGVIADRFEQATVLFADIVDFTPRSAGARPEEVVRLLDEVFTTFDGLAHEHGLEKIKTIGDAYMVAGGIPVPRQDHLEAVAGMALAMTPAVRAIGGLELRIGIDTGPVVAGVIGRSRFIYDLWGDTVNTASRMESQGIPGRIQVTERVASALEPCFVLEPRGTVEVKGKGPMSTWFLVGAR